MTTNELLPQGTAAALLPQVSFTVPGLFLFSELVYQCIQQVEAKFSYHIPVRFLYGSPQVRWNCGRLVLINHHESLDEMERELKGAVAHGITPLLTFTSPLLQQEDLKDPVCNGLLEILEEVRGGVVLASPLLRDYIRSSYPHVSMHASIILTTYAQERSAAYYRQLAQDYDYYVIHSDDKFHPELLRQLPKENAEIILNERCGYQCPQRQEHFISIAQDQTALLDGCGPLSNFLDRCPYVPEGKQREMPTRSISSTVREAAALAEMGFPLFKLQGRLDSPYVFFFDFLRYALEGELAFPTMYPIFSYSIYNYLKEKERKRRERTKSSAPQK